MSEWKMSSLECVSRGASGTLTFPFLAIALRNLNGRVVIMLHGGGCV